MYTYLRHAVVSLVGVLLGGCHMMFWSEVQGLTVEARYPPVARKSVVVLWATPWPSSALRYEQTPTLPCEVQTFGMMQVRFKSAWGAKASVEDRIRRVAASHGANVVVLHDHSKEVVREECGFDESYPCDGEIEVYDADLGRCPP